MKRLLSVFVTLSMLLSMLGAGIPALAGSPAAIVVDGNLSDWADIYPAVSDTTLDVAPGTPNITHVYLAEDADNVYVRVDGMIGPPVPIHIDIDSDDDPGTGYNPDVSDPGNLFSSNHGSGFDYTAIISYQQAMPGQPVINLWDWTNHPPTAVTTTPGLMVANNGVSPPNPFIYETAIPKALVGNTFPWNIVVRVETVPPAAPGTNDEEPAPGFVSIGQAAPAFQTWYINGDLNSSSWLELTNDPNTVASVQPTSAMSYSFNRAYYSGSTQTVDFPEGDWTIHLEFDAPVTRNIVFGVEYSDAANFLSQKVETPVQTLNNATGVDLNVHVPAFTTHPGGGIGMYWLGEDGTSTPLRVGGTRSYLRTPLSSPALDCPPYTNDSRASSIQSTSAVVSTTVAYLGSFNPVSVQFSVWDAELSEHVYVDGVPASVASPGQVVTATLTGLTPGTSQSVSVKVNLGNEQFNWGKNISFDTPAAAVQRTLTMAKIGSGTITPDVGTHPYDENFVVDISAVADEGWSFVSWTGDVADNTVADTTVIMNADKTVTAVFAEDTAPTPKPDLTVPSVLAQWVDAEAGTYQVQFTIVNNSLTAAPASLARFSIDGVLNATIMDVSALEPTGGNDTATFTTATITLSDGSDEVIVYADYGASGSGGIDEESETNNSHTITVTPSLGWQPKADLIINEVHAEWTNPVTGMYQVHFSVTNVSPSAASASHAKVNIDGTDRATVAVPALAAGGTHGGWFIGPFTAGMPPDAETIVVTADSDTEVDEQFENNNTREFIWNRASGEPTKPNLIVAEKHETWDSPEAAESTYRVSFNVVNASPVAAGTFKVGYSIDGVAQAETVTVASLAGGANFAGEFPTALSVTDGFDTIVVTVDVDTSVNAYGQVDEEFENDNTLTNIWNAKPVPPSPTAILNPANGHYYELVQAVAGINWDDAKTAAEAKSYEGMPGHLVTVTSTAETGFIVDNDLMGEGAWIGGFQSADGAEPDGGWQWVTGEAWDYTLWNSSEPNDSLGQGEEDVIHMLGWGSAYWNDSPRHFLLNAYVVEYEAPAAPVQSWLFMVYMAADNSLNDFALGDINEMESVGPSDNVTSVVLLDLADDAGTVEVDDNTTAYLIVQDDTAGIASTVFNPTEAWSWGAEANMGDPAVLAEFVGKTKAAFPADRYVLVLWNHGSGIRSAALAEEVTNKWIAEDVTDGDYMFIWEISDALDPVTTAAPIDILAFDACVMQMAEIGYEIRGNANIMVGAEDVIPGNGYPYDAFLNGLVATPGMSPEQFAAWMVARYAEEYPAPTWEPIYGLSAVDLTQMESLGAAIDGFAAALLSDAEPEALLFASYAVEFFEDADFVDLQDFAQKVRQFSEAATVDAAVDALLPAINSAVLVNYPGAGGHPNAYGLSIYLPVSYVDSDYYNLDFVTDTQWDEFIDAFLSLLVTEPAWTTALSDAAADEVPTGTPDIAGVDAALGDEGQMPALYVQVRTNNEQIAYHNFEGITLLDVDQNAATGQMVGPPEAQFGADYMVFVTAGPPADQSKGGASRIEETPWAVLQKFVGGAIEWEPIVRLPLFDNVSSYWTYIPLSLLDTGSGPDDGNVGFAQIVGTKNPVQWTDAAPDMQVGPGKPEPQMLVEDTFGDGGTGPDIIDIMGYRTPDQVGFSVAFNFDSADVWGTFYLDTDGSVATGGTSGALDGRNFGADYKVGIVLGPTAPVATLFHWIKDPDVPSSPEWDAGQAITSFGSDAYGFWFDLPLSVLGDDDGQMNFVLLMGADGQPYSDVAPDEGFGTFRDPLWIQLVEDATGDAEAGAPDLLTLSYYNTDLSSVVRIAPPSPVVFFRVEAADFDRYSFYAETMLDVDRDATTGDLFEDIGVDYIVRITGQAGGPPTGELLRWNSDVIAWDAAGPLGVFAGADYFWFGVSVDRLVNPDTTPEDGFMDIIQALQPAINTPADYAPDTGHTSIAPRTAAEAKDDGLAWLVSQQNSTDGSWGTNYQLAKTGLAVYKLEMNAWSQGIDPFSVDYVYRDYVMAGLNYIFSRAYTMDISAAQPAQPPAYVDNAPADEGILFYEPYDQHHETYYTAISLMALSASGHPEYTIADGGTLDGRTIGNVIANTVDYFAYGQTDWGSGRGGWGYGASTPSTGDWSDESNAGWVTIALATAEEAGVLTPDWVRNELDLWVNGIQDPVDGDGNDGGANYNGPGGMNAGWINSLRTGNMLQQQAFLGDTPASLRVQDALDYLSRHWADGWDVGWRGYPSAYQATYTVMKGLEALGVADLPGTPPIDWFTDFETALIGEQLPDGSWPQSAFDDSDRILSTVWALLTLQKEVPETRVGPDLVIKNKREEWVTQGSTYRIIFDLANVGNTLVEPPQAAPIVVSVQIDTNNPFPVTVPLTQPILPGQSVEVRLGFTTPFTLTDGEDTIIVTADSTNVIPELNEDNNVTRNGFPPRTDLTILEKHEEWVYAGGLYQVYFTLKNVGNTVIPGGHHVGVSIDGILQVATFPVYHDMKPNEEIRATFFNSQFPFSAPEDVVVVIADAGQTVTEANESNNAIENVLRPPPTKTDLGVAEKWEESVQDQPTQFNVRYRIMNWGDTRYTGDVTIALFLNGAVEPDQTVTVPVDLAKGQAWPANGSPEPPTAPDPAATFPNPVTRDVDGIDEIRVVVDWGNLVDEGNNEFNNEMVNTYAPDEWYYKQGWNNYAPAGMPDFDQKQGNWGVQRQDQSRIWTFSGPAALADAIWWFDSKFETEQSGTPGDGSDQYGLIKNFDYLSPANPGPLFDDHSFNNANNLATSWKAVAPPGPSAWEPGVQPQTPPAGEQWGEFIERMAWHLDTDGAASSTTGQLGTTPAGMETAIDFLLSRQTALGLLARHTVKAPAYETITYEVGKSQAAIVLLGFWYKDASNPSAPWQRLGGHWVTVAGFNGPEGKLSISDPYYDGNNQTPGDPTAHNNAANVAHDVYEIKGGFAYTDMGPVSTIGFRHYPAWSQSGMQDMVGQNLPPEFAQYVTNVVPQPGTPIMFATEIEYAIFISPTETGPDTTPPYVSGAMPPHGSTGIPVVARPGITFSEAMNKASVEAAFQITPNVPGAFVWGAGDTYLELQPSGILAANFTYIITIGTGAEDVAGNNMTDPYSYSFTTASGQPPEWSVNVTAPNGGQNWAIGSVQTITWTSSGLGGGVHIYVWRDATQTWEKIFNNISNSGSQEWTVTGPANTHAKIKVECAISAYMNDVSDAEFTISAAAPTTRTLTMAVDPEDGGTTDPAVGPHTYNNGTGVNIAATANEGFEFVNWTGGTDTIADVNAASTTIEMDADYSITANFRQLKPDLVITSKVEDWTNADLGEYTVTVRVENQGEFEAAPENGIVVGLEIDGVAVETKTYTQTVAADSFFDIFFEVTMTGDADVITVTVDPSPGSVEESDETNNAITNTWNAAKPDLIISAKAEPWVQDEEGVNYTVTFTVKNIGLVSAPAGHFVGLKIDGAPQQQKVEVPVSLAYNETWDGAFTTPIALEGSSDEVRVVADVDADVSEANENNNELSNTKSLKVDIWIVPTTQVVGINQTFSVQIWVDARLQDIDTIQAYLDYLPEYLQVVDGDGNVISGVDNAPITSGAIVLGDTADASFPARNQQKVDNTAGKLDLALGIGTSGFPVQEEFLLATVRFKALQITDPDVTSLVFQTADSLRTTKAIRTLDEIGWDPNVTGSITGGEVNVIEGVPVNLALTLQRGPTQPADQWVIPVRVWVHAVDTIWDPQAHNNGAALYIETTTNSQGRVTVVVPPGTWNIRVKGETTLKLLKRNVVVALGMGTVTMGTLLEGDTNDDNVIDGLDYSTVVMCYGTSADPGQPSYLPQSPSADLNNDGVVEGLDYSRLLANFLKKGADIP